MKEMDISLVLKKAEELKSLFVLGQRVVPFLEEIFVFVNEIKPLLDDINSSIEENLKKMPSASRQLSKVTEATEVATTEIMDIVEGLVSKADIILSNIKNITDSQTNNSRKLTDALQSIKQLISGRDDSDVIISIIDSTLSNAKIDYLSNQENLDGGIIGRTNSLVESIKDDSNSVMMTLQVQDITSQQIAAVNHLLETIQQKLGSILKKFQSSEISGVLNSSKNIENSNVSHLHRDIAFDPHAVDSIAMKENRQDDIDAFIKEQSINSQDLEKTYDELLSSQNELDALFSSKLTDDIISLQEKPPVENIDKSKNENFVQISQDDIDELFGK